MSGQVKKIIHYKIYKNEEFNKDEHKMKQFIKDVNNLQINEDLFKIIRILIRFFRFPILVLLQPIYQRIELEKERYILSNHEEIIKTAGIVRSILRSRHIHSLEFYFRAGCVSDEIETATEDEKQRAFIANVMLLDSRLNQKGYNNPLQQNTRFKDIEQLVRKFQESSQTVLQKMCIEQYMKEVKYRLYQIQKQLTLQKQSESPTRKIKQSKIKRSIVINGPQEIKIEDQAAQNEFLCCRSYFYQNQIIDEPETLVQEYKDYDYPFNRYLKDVLLKTICGFLNARGGIIYIGIKEVFQTKQRIVVGQIFT